MTEHLANIRKLKDKIHKTRGYLSFTAKVEDLYVVHKWTQTYGVPHYYFQVFFDRVYGISFEHILRVISTPENEGRRFTTERNKIIDNQVWRYEVVNPQVGLAHLYFPTLNKP